jgi:mRNA interferase RelE/StbE
MDDRVTLGLGKYLDDPEGLSEVLAAVDGLADDPRPAGAVPWGPTMCRLRVGPYRVLYEITDTTVYVRHLDRVL